MYWLPRSKVLVPTDFSEPSVDAIHTGLAMVELGHDVHTLHVVEPVAADVLAELPDSFDKAASESSRREHWQEHLQAFLQKHDLHGLTNAVLTGEPAATITRYARENEIDLIVIAAHGYQQGERISIGSVTERVLHNADCPVLVLRPDGRVPGCRAGSGIRRSDGYSPADSGLRNAR